VTHAPHIRAMNIKFALILFLAAVLTVVGCSDDAAHKETAKTTETGMIHDEGTLRVVIHWPGDDFASRQDIETRNKIQNLMAERNVGKVVRVGTGMGWMDIIVEVKDKKIARSSISEIMRIVAPARKFTIE
jgi:altronate dehydratase